MVTKQKYNTLLAQKVIGEFEKRNIEGYYCQTKEDALKKALEFVPAQSTVSCGGSETLNEIGLREALKTGEFIFLDPKSAKGVSEMQRVAHEALNSDYYFLSANAISATGELVNIDGIGNRTASLIYGPKNVIVIAGMNKVELTLEAAVLRAKNYASQMGLLAFKPDYASFDEVVKDAAGLGSQLVITSKSVIKGRIKLILVGQDLGF